MSRIVAGIRVIIAVVMLAAVGTLLAEAIAEGTFVPWDFFGFFTIQNNLLGAAALGLSTAYAARVRPSWVEYVRVCAAVDLAIVVTVYWMLLAPTDPDAARWTNLVLHGLSGAALVADWLLSGPRRPLPFSRVHVVLAYPLVWIVVTLTRGATDGWVPYPFLEPDNGYASIAIVVAGIVIAGFAVGAALFRATGWRVIDTEHRPRGR